MSVITVGELCLEGTITRLHSWHPARYPVAVLHRVAGTIDHDFSSANETSYDQS